MRPWVTPETVSLAVRKPWEFEGLQGRATKDSEGTHKKLSWIELISSFFLDSNRVPKMKKRKKLKQPNVSLTLNSASFFLSFLFLSASATIPTVAVLCISGDDPSSVRPKADERRLEKSALSSTWRNTAGVGDRTMLKLPLSGLRFAEPRRFPDGLSYPLSGLRFADPRREPEGLPRFPVGEPSGDWPVIDTWHFYRDLLFTWSVLKPFPIRWSTKVLIWVLNFLNMGDLIRFEAIKSD